MSGLVGYGNDPVKIVSGVDSPSAKEWTFDSDGNLQLPAGGDIVDSEGNTVLDGTGGGTPSDLGNFELKDSVIYSTDNNVLIVNDFNAPNYVSTSHWYKKATRYTVYPQSYESVTIAGSVFDSNGNIIVAYNYSDILNMYYSVIEKYDTTGNVVWSKSIRGDTDEQENQYKGVETLAIKIDSQNNIIFCSNRYSIHGWIVTKLDTNGNYVWSNLVYYQLDPSEEARVFDLSIGVNDTITVIANQNTYLATFTSTGNSFSYIPKTKNDEIASCVINTPTGYSLVGDYDGFVHKFSITGSYVWSNKVNPNGAPIGRLTQNGDNYYATSGSKYDLISAFDFNNNDPKWTLYVINNRDLIFVPFFGPVPQPIEKFRIQERNGYLYAFGVTKGVNNRRNCVLLKIDSSNGSLVWVRGIDFNITNISDPEAKSIRLNDTTILLSIDVKDTSRTYSPRNSYVLKLPIDGSLTGSFGDFNIYDDRDIMNPVSGTPVKDEEIKSFSAQLPAAIRYDPVFVSTDSRLIRTIQFLNNGPRAWNLSNTLTFPDGTQQVTAYDGLAENSKKIGLLDQREVAPTYKRVWTRSVIVNYGNGRTYAGIDSYNPYDFWLVDSWQYGSWVFNLGGKFDNILAEDHDGRTVTIRTRENTEIWVVTDAEFGFEDPENPGEFRFNRSEDGYAWEIPNSYRLKDNRTYTWTYNRDRDAWFLINDAIKPSGTISRTIDSNVNAGTPTTVWTSSETYISSAKLLIQVESNEIGDNTGWHCQSCEAIISSRGSIGNDSTFGIGNPVVSVYGITYTGSGNLMTFTVQRNITTNLIEVVGTATGIVDTIANVRITSTEMITRDR